MLPRLSMRGVGGLAGLTGPLHFASKQPGTRSVFAEPHSNPHNASKLQQSVHSGQYSAGGRSIGMLMKGLDGGAVFTRMALNKSPLNLSQASGSVHNAEQQPLRQSIPDNGSQKSKEQ